MSTFVVAYQADDSTRVLFEIEPAEGFRPAGGAGQVLGRISDAVGPAVEAAKAVIEKVKEVQPDGVEVKFGVKASGGADWLVAKAAAEGSFEITLTWTRGPSSGRVPPSGTGDADELAADPTALEGGASEDPNGAGLGPAEGLHAGSE